jgi:hypothetical protein
MRIFDVRVLHPGSVPLLSPGDNLFSQFLAIHHLLGVRAFSIVCSQ